MQYWLEEFLFFWQSKWQCWDRSCAVSSPFFFVSCLNCWKWKFGGVNYYIVLLVFLFAFQRTKARALPVVVPIKMMEIQLMQEGTTQTALRLSSMFDWKQGLPWQNNQTLEVDFAVELVKAPVCRRAGPGRRRTCFQISKWQRSLDNSSNRPWQPTPSTLKPFRLSIL